MHLPFATRLREHAQAAAYAGTIRSLFALIITPNEQDKVLDGHVREH